VAVTDEEVRRAIDHAWRALGARDRTEAELRALLERKRVEPSAIDAALAELRAGGYVDDANYARRFAEDRRTLDRWGRERIERGLRRRGIADELIEAALAEGGQGAELSRARELLSRRFAAGLADDRERDRAWRLLVRRGFAAELAYDAVRAHERAVRNRAA
jgi:regulatory protein